MEYIIEFSIFAGKVFVVVIGIIMITMMMASVALRGKADQIKLSIRKLNKRYDRYKKVLQRKLLSKKEFKAFQKQEKKDEKNNGSKKKPNIFVLQFKGDIQAQSLDELRKEIDAILQVIKSGEEVIVRLESPGGAAHAYGLAAAQLLRLKKNNSKLTICVDKVAASGGYMMACTGDKILSSPFAILGSIGVVAQIPNMHRLLKKYDVDFQEITAGEHKRTLTMFGEVTEQGKQKFTEQLEDIHSLFKDFVKTNRPQLDMSVVATGEFWLGQKALEKKLCDELMTSDEYLMDKSNTHNIYMVKIIPKKSFSNKIAEMMSLSLDKVFHRAAEHWPYLQ